MQEKTKKLVTIVMLLLALVGSLLAVFFSMNQESTTLYWAAYWLTICLAVVAVILIAVFSVANLAKSRKKLIGFIIGLVAVVAVVVVLYLIAPATDISQATIAKYNVTDGVSKFVSVGMYLVYALVAATVIAIIYSECSKAFKKK